MISIVVPCYNEEKNIHRLVERFCSVAEQFESSGFELLLVNNGSEDGTSTAIEKEAENHDFIKKIEIAKNEGYGHGINEGLKNCQGEWLGWIHADLQLPPEAFLEFNNFIKTKPSIASNTFFKGKRSNRSLSDSFFTIAMGLFESTYLWKGLWDINAQPTLISREFYNKIGNPPKDFSFDLYVYYLSKKRGMNIVRIPVKQQKREEGVSSWNNGIKSRIRLIKRTLSFSKELKNNIRK